MTSSPLRHHHNHNHNNNNKCCCYTRRRRYFFSFVFIPLLLLLLGWIFLSWKTSLLVLNSLKQEQAFRSKALQSFRGGTSTTSSTNYSPYQQLHDDQTDKHQVNPTPTNDNNYNKDHSMIETPRTENIHNNENLFPLISSSPSELTHNIFHFSSHLINNNKLKPSGSRYLVIQSDSRLRNTTSTTSSFSNHAVAPSILMMADWAKSNGYGYLFFDGPGPKCAHPNQAGKTIASFWCKVPSLLYAFHLARAWNFSGVLFADSDVGPQIFSPPVLIDDVPIPPNKHVVLLSARGQVWGQAVMNIYKCGSVNSGVLFYKTTDETWNLLKQWWFESTLIPTPFEVVKSYVDVRIALLIPKHLLLASPNNANQQQHIPNPNNHKPSQESLTSKKPIKFPPFIKNSINQYLKTARGNVEAWDEIFISYGSVSIPNVTRSTVITRNANNKQAITKQIIYTPPPGMERLLITFKFHTPYQVHHDKVVSSSDGGQTQQQQQDIHDFKSRLTKFRTWCCTKSPANTNNNNNSYSQGMCESLLYESNLLKRYLIPTATFSLLRNVTQIVGIMCTSRWFNTINHWPGDQDRLNHLSCSPPHQSIVHISSANDFVFGSMHKSPHAVLHHWVNPNKNLTPNHLAVLIKLKNQHSFIKVNGIINMPGKFLRKK
jgi:hypothetical protein